MTPRRPSEKVKTTVELPGDLWRAAKIRAMDERADLRSVLIRALEHYLRADTPTEPAAVAAAPVEPAPTESADPRPS